MDNISRITQNSYLGLFSDLKEGPGPQWEWWNLIHVLVHQSRCVVLPVLCGEDKWVRPGSKVVLNVLPLLTHVGRRTWLGSLHKVSEECIVHTTHQSGHLRGIWSQESRTSHPLVKMLKAVVVNSAVSFYFYF